MTPRKKELPATIDTPGGDAAGAEPSAAPKAEPSAQPQEAKQAPARARSRRKPAGSPAADKPAAADASADAASARRRAARKKASEPAAAGEVQPPEEAAAEAVKPLSTLLADGKLKKKERNETHDKDRVYIRKDLKARLDRLAQQHGKGFKTLLFNYGLERAIDELEQANLHAPDRAPDTP